jgi:hypothetical protein
MVLAWNPWLIRSHVVLPALVGEFTDPLMTSRWR